MARATNPSRTSTNGNGTDPAKDLEAEVTALRDDIAAITATIGDIAKHRSREVQSEVRKVGKNVAHKGEEAVEAIQENYEAAEDEFKSMIRDKPITSVLVAAGIGYVLSKVLRI